MPELETPMGLALCVCDMVIEDKLTGKKSLIGMCDRISASRFPCVHPEMCVYVSMTSGRGEYPCEIVCKHVDNETVAFAAKGKVALPEPARVVDLVFRMRGVRFAKSGMYWLHFITDDVPIMMRPFFVKEMEQPPQGQQPGVPPGA